jgi:hypothetical protein
MLKFTKLRSLVLALLASATLAGCGEASIYVATPVVVGHAQIAYLDLVPTRIGPQTIQLDWSFDPAAYSYLVRRDGFDLANLSSNSLIDDSGLLGNRYCYDVLGLSAGGRVISQSPIACITLF